MPAAPEDKRPDPLIGRVIAGKYEVQSLLGVGAMGRVYRAHHAALDKVVAVKVLHTPELARDPTLAQRFKSEARAASRLDHPNSVQVLDFGEDGADKLLYIAMELLQGQNLGDVLKRVGRLSALRSCNIMMQVLAALAAAHRSGVVHRDLKPANIMLVKKRDDEGEVNDFVKVCDFGIAKVMDNAAPDEATAVTMTKQGAIFGTPAFMSPEQARGEKVDFRTDIYSCGVILYRMIGGRTPFQAETTFGLLTKLMTEEAAPLSQLASTVDPRLEAVVMRGIAKDRQQRWQTALEMRSAIKELLSEDGAVMATMPPANASQLAGDATAPPPAAPFQTLTNAPWPRSPSATGTWTGSGTMRPAPEPPRSRMQSLTLPLIVLLVLAVLGGGGWFVRDRYQRHTAVSRLAEFIGIGSFGAAESFFNEHFDDFKTNPGALSLIPEILRQRRAAEQYESRLGVRFEPGFQLTPSRWIGTYVQPQEKRVQRFICVFEHADGALYDGYLDWPEAGVRAAIRGIRDGNHLVFWDYAVIGGSGPEVKRYILNDKKNVFIDGDHFSGTDGPFLAKIEAKIAGPY